MKIKEIEIDGFGAWTGLKLSDLPADALVIYGPNEAGKTTLMQFVRTVLYGFSPQRRLRYLPPVHGGSPGGRLLLGDSTAEYVCQRRVALDSKDGDRGDLTIVDGQGRARGPEKLAELLASIDESTFNNVFAIGLREIQELSSLDDTAAADHLYKLATGLDRVSLVDVARELGQSRQRLLNEEKTGQILQLIERRDRLQAEVAQLTAAGRKWAELAAERTSLAEEAQQLEEAIEKSDASSKLIEAALDVQDPWQGRLEVERQLRALGEVRPLPDKALERLEMLNRRIVTGRKKLKQISHRRKKLQAQAEELQVNRILLNQAPRIEALNEHSQWIITLEQQIQKLSDEILKIETDIEAQLGGVANRTQGVAGSSLDQLPKDIVSVLRRPAALVKEATENLDKARKELDAAKSEADQVVSQTEAAGRERKIGDVGKALKSAGEKVALLRKRIQLEERLDQLTRRREELDFNDEELQEFEATPLRVTVALGGVFALGMLLLGIGMFGTALNIVQTGMPWGIFGVLMLGLAGGTRLFLDRQTEGTEIDSHRHLDQVKTQLEEAKRQRDEIDAQLPAGGGQLDVRLREAEAELRELEKLAPLKAERESLESRHKSAERRLSESQEALKEAKHRWRNALRSVGLPEDFAPSQVKSVMKEAGNVADLRRRRETRLEEMEQRQRELLLLTTRIQQLLADVRLTPKSDRPQALLHQLAQAWAEEKERVEQRANLMQKGRKLKKFRVKCVKIIKAATRRRQALLTLAGVADQKAFRQIAADAALSTELQQKLHELTAKIRQSLTGRSSEAAVGELLLQPGNELERNWNKRVSQLQEVRARLADLHKRQGACTHEMQTLAADRRLTHKSLELTMVEEQLRRDARRWQVLTLVGRGLESVRKAYETNRQPETLRDASQYLKRLTLGHYHRIWMPLDRQVLLVEDVQGQTLALDLLSRGTREAVYLSLRMALVVSFARRGARIPLVLDDVLVNFDAARVRAAAECFRDFAAEGYQLIMFTCHEHIRELFESLEVEVRTLPARTSQETLAAEPPKKPKRRKPDVQPPPEPVAELSPPPLPLVPEEPSPRATPVIDPNLLFSAAAEEDWNFDTTNAHEIAAEPALPKQYRIISHSELPSQWPLAVPPPASPARKVRRSAAPAKPLVPPAASNPLPDFWPVAEPPAPAPPAPQYEVISFRYLPEAPAAPPRASAPPPPPPPPRPTILEPAAPVVAAEPAPSTDPPAPAKREKSPKPAKPLPMAESQTGTLVGHRVRERRFAWDSPEVYWDE